MTNCPLIFMIILSLPNEISILTNKFGMYNVITSLLCFTPITIVVKIASNAVVGLVASFVLWIFARLHIFPNLIHAVTFVVQVLLMNYHAHTEILRHTMFF